MRRNILLAATLAVVTLSATFTQAYTIADTYIGADPTHNYKHIDVIGNPAYYDIDGMNVGVAGPTMTVDIFTSFVTKTATTNIWNEQTHIGDLFLATGGWKPSGAAPYLNDRVGATGTVWDYVAVLTPHIPTVQNDATAQGIVSVYATKDGTFVKSNIGTLPSSGWIYRSEQYVQFVPNTTVQALATGTWSVTGTPFTKAVLDETTNKTVNATYEDLQLSFDFTKIVPLGSDWGFHWAMTCANDVIEGSYSLPVARTFDVDPIPAPEPGTLLLLGTGLLPLALLRKRLQK